MIFLACLSLAPCRGRGSRPGAAVRLGPELALKLHEAPDLGAVHADVGLNVGGRLLDGGQLDVEQLRAPRSAGPGSCQVPTMAAYRTYVLNRIGNPAYHDQRIVGGIGGTEHRPAWVNTGYSQQVDSLAGCRARHGAAGGETGRLAPLRQRFGVRGHDGVSESPGWALPIAGRMHRGRVTQGTPIKCPAALLAHPAPRILAGSEVASTDRRGRRAAR
jgi:hypothetical protein